MTQNIYPWFGQARRMRYIIIGDKPCKVVDFSFPKVPNAKYGLFIAIDIVRGVRKELNLPVKSKLSIPTKKSYTLVNLQIDGEEISEITLMDELGNVVDNAIMSYELKEHEELLIEVYRSGKDISLEVVETDDTKVIISWIVVQ